MMMMENVVLFCKWNEPYPVFFPFPKFHNDIIIHHDAFVFVVGTGWGSICVCVCVCNIQVTLTCNHAQTHLYTNKQTKKIIMKDWNFETCACVCGFSVDEEFEFEIFFSFSKKFYHSSLSSDLFIAAEIKCKFSFFFVFCSVFSRFKFVIRHFSINFGLFIIQMPKPNRLSIVWLL